MKGKHAFAFGVITGFGLTWLYHHFAPGKGIGAPGGSSSS